MSSLYTWVLRLIGGLNSTQWQAVLQFVLAAEERITEGVDKRAWVIDKLQNVGVTGRWANYAVEVGLAWLERQGKVNSESDR